jgi:hypothetical protein
MTEFIKPQTPTETIQIGFPDQKVSRRAGRLTFAGFLHRHRFGQWLASVAASTQQQESHSDVGMDPENCGEPFVGGWRFARASRQQA